MSKNTISAQDLAALLPVSKTISEKLTPEEYAEFTAQISAISEAQLSLKSDNDDLTARVSSLTTRAADAEAKVSTLENVKLLLQADVAALQPFRQKVEQIVASGRSLPASDVSTAAQATTAAPAGSPDALAIAAFKAAKGIK